MSNVSLESIDFNEQKQVNKIYFFVCVCSAEEKKAVKVGEIRVHK